MPRLQLEYKRETTTCRLQEDYNVSQLATSFVAPTKTIGPQLGLKWINAGLRGPRLSLWIGFRFKSRFNKNRCPAHWAVVISCLLTHQSVYLTSPLSACADDIDIYLVLVRQYDVVCGARIRGVIERGDVVGRAEARTQQTLLSSLACWGWRWWPRMDVAVRH